MKCFYCGRQLNNDAEYCSFCGRKAVHVPPVFTMAKIGTDIATEAIRDYSEWGFYNNPDAELNPETGRKPEYTFSALDSLPKEDPLKWAKEFMEADAAEAAAEATGEAGETEGDAPEDASEETGTEAPDGEASLSENQSGKAKKKKLPVAVIVLLIVLLTAGAAAAAYMLFINDKSYEVDLSKVMTEPKVIGYDGYGEMALMPQIDAAKEDEWLRTVNLDNDKKAFKEVLDTVTYTPDKTEDLSNGDTVTITVDYDKSLAREKKLKVIAETITYEVGGLEIGKDLAYDPDVYHSYYDDFILPESDRAYLTREDVAYSTDGSEELTQQAINEIYARHGWIFGNDHYNKLFRGFEWYVPMYEPEKFDESWLNDYEKTNLSLLTQYRNDLRKAAEEAEKKAAEEAAKKEAEEAAKKTTEPSSVKSQDKDGNE